MQYIDIFAGQTAISQIREQGFSADMFDTFLGASGGPKWFVLAGLDKVIVPEFLSKSAHHINLIGSSAGAFRIACLAQNNPVDAIERLASKYSHTTYSDKPSVAEITDKAYELLNYVMGSCGVDEVLSNTRFHAHFSVAHCHGNVAIESKYKQMQGLLSAALRNAVSRKRLSKSFTRALFSKKVSCHLFEDPADFPTDHYQLSKDNFLDSLMASGSIPLILAGVENINGAKPGMYRDGGIIDYHFDLKINSKKLVIYPHFYSTPTPGWFDKGLKRRQCHSSSYDNVVLVAPSKAFVDSLPFKKIPDRKDFESMPAQQRIDYWQQVIDQSNRMADEFMQLVQSQAIVDRVKPIVLTRS